MPHESARGHVTGEALYTDDLLSRFPNLLHAWPVMAPHAHALVKTLDVSAALWRAGRRNGSHRRRCSRRRRLRVEPAR